MQNSRYKLLVTDVDGTLINSKGEITAETCEALKLARASGIKIALATGRFPKSCTNLVEELSLDGCHAFCDGSLVSDVRSNAVIQKKPINPKLAREMALFARDNRIFIEFHTPTSYYAVSNNWWTEANSRYFDINVRIRDLTNLDDHEQVLKAQLMFNNTGERTLTEKFREHFSGNADFREVKSPSYPDATFINVLAPGVSKGTALQAMARHLDIPLDQVAAIGDWLNDIPMISAAGLGIAMGNSPAELQSVADHVTLGVEENGFAAAVHKYLL